MKPPPGQEWIAHGELIFFICAVLIVLNMVAFFCAIPPTIKMTEGE